METAVLEQQTQTTDLKELYKALFNAAADILAEENLLSCEFENVADYEAAFDKAADLLAGANRLGDVEDALQGNEEAQNLFKEICPTMEKEFGM